jgi:sulfoxide reductase heme-binding subunit YedZ
MTNPRRTRDRLIYWAVWISCFLPLPFLVYWGAMDQLSADPIKEGIHYLGEWGLRLLAVTLAITPARKLLGWGWLQRFRRTVGVFAFAYIALHLTAYIAVDQGFDWPHIWGDIVKRPYITFGMIGFVLLIPLAVTSTNAMIRRLGARRWRNLHRLVYVIAPLGVLHYDLLVKRDASWPHFYAAIIGALLLYRVYEALKNGLSRRRAASFGATMRLPG